MIVSILFLFLMAPFSHAEVAFEGIPHEQQTQLLKQFPELTAGEIAPALADRIVRSLLSSGEFENASVLRDDGQYRVVGTPLRTVAGLAFRGNRAIRSGELADATQIRPDQRFDRRKAIEGGEQIRNLYGERGYFNSVVQVEFSLPTVNQVQIVYTITENKPCLIDGIIFNTDNAQLRERLTERTQRFARRYFTQANTSALEDRVRKYFRSERYLKAQLVQSRVQYNADRTRATLVYDVVDPYRYQVFADGNDRIDDSDIFRTLGLDSLEQALLEPGTELAERLRAKYLSLGYANVTVTPEETTVKDSFIRRLRLKISEGPRVRIDRIDVTGRISRDARYYADFIRSNSTDLISSDHFNREGLELGYRNLVTHLKNQGYLRAKMQSARIEYLDEAKSKVSVLITLDEGPLTQVRRVQLINARAFSNIELLEAMGLEPNAPLRLNELEGSLQALRNYYHSRGYIEMKILNEDESIVQYNDTGSQANLQIEIYEGPQIRVASIITEGNTFTRDYVIFREIDISAGDILTSEKIETSILRLNRLGLFASADIRTLEAGTEVSERTVVIAVTEGNPGIFRVGAGVHNERRVMTRGYTSMSYNNLGGTARAVTGRIELRDNPGEQERFEYRFTAGYLEPFLFNTRTRGRTNLMLFKDLGLQGRNVQEGLQVDFLFERDLTNSTKLAWLLWGLNSRSERQLDPSLVDTPNNQKVALVGPTLTIDHRDNPFLPSRGTFTRLSATYSDPVFGSSEPVNFVKTEGSTTYYKALGSPRWVWANHFRGGYLRNVSSREGSGVPASQAFFLGGLTTVRGYGGGSRNEFFPAYPQLDQVDSGTVLVVSGDSAYYLVKSELRFPLYGNFGGVVFYDAGEVMVSGERFTQPFRQGTGFGFRFNTPLGPVALDLGFKIDPLPGARPFWLHFAIGTF